MSMIESWDRQQELYIGAREARFDALLSTVEWHTASAGSPNPTVVDLCCGPAAIGQRLIGRLPGARYIGVDIDPVLLDLARQVAGEFEPSRMEIVECDVTDPAWRERVGAAQVDVVCSSTALHWLSDDELDRTMVLALEALRPGGVLLNADHLAFDNKPSFTALAAWNAGRDASAAMSSGATSWSAWWAAARADERLGPLCLRRDDVFPPTAPAVPAVDELDAVKASADRRPPLAGFVDAARRAGFVEVDTIWQRFDDRIVMAVKSGTDPQ